MDTFTSWRAFFCSVLFPKILQAVLIGFSKPLRIDFPTAPPKTTAQQKNSPKSGSLSYSCCTTKSIYQKIPHFSSARLQPVNRKPTKEPFLTPLISEALAPALGGDLWSGPSTNGAKSRTPTHLTPLPPKQKKGCHPKKN